MKTLFSLIFSLSFFSSQIWGQVIELKSDVKDKELTLVRLLLNWVPEPEFGGFYSAQVDGFDQKNGIKLEVLPGRAGTPTVQMLSSNKMDVVVTSASELVIARSQGQKVIAIFSTFDVAPTGIMVHRSRGLKNLGDLFKQGGTLAIDRGQAYTDFLEKKFGFEKMKLVPYTGGVGSFLKDPMFAQQGFLFSEPLSAEREGAQPQFFLLADEGYNPYVQIVAVREDYLAKNGDLVKRLYNTFKEGWVHYLAHPEKANAAMAKLNLAMDEATFKKATEIQKPLFAQKPEMIGQMTEERWKSHIDQLIAAKTIRKKVDARDCFRHITE